MLYCNSKIALLSILTVAIPSLVLAAANTGPACEVLRNITSVVRILGTVVIVIAAAMLLWAGFLFMTGGGNEETLKKAKSILIYSLIGLAVALLATQADDIVKAIVGGAFTSECGNVI